MDDWVLNTNFLPSYSIKLKFCTVVNYVDRITIFDCSTYTVENIDAFPDLTKTFLMLDFLGQWLKGVLTFYNYYIFACNLLIRAMSGESDLVWRSHLCQKYELQFLPPPSPLRFLSDVVSEIRSTAQGEILLTTSLDHLRKKKHCNTSMPILNLFS